ncbi:MAG TPA: LytTR family DNA-binding domain-containing protein, partial [Chitinophagaceae bacterium]|nr:LytTR family DNA-binding domain-containing protein [Chitinophagaceae bacterium]
MKILLVDNEKTVRETLATMVQNWSNGMHQIEEAAGVKEGVSTINQLKPDIVLLDVEMDDGTGFDLLQQIPQPGFQLIFTTAHNEYAIQAFRYSAIDYLLKPVDPAELRQALERAMIQISQQTMQQQLTILLQQLGGRTDTEKQIVLKDVDKTYFIKIRDILFCEAEGSYTKFYLSNAEPVFVSRNLRSYEEILAPAGFIR